MDGEFLKLEIQGKDLYLEEMKLKGIKSFSILKNSALPRGKAEFEIKLIVEFPDNREPEK